MVATNKNLKQLVKEGKFREDLFFRLNVVEINTPSLREHLEDLSVLTETIIQEFNRVMGKRVSMVNPTALSIQTGHFEGIGRESEDWLDVSNPISEIRDYAERELLLRVLSGRKGNKSRAALALKITRPLLYKKMKRLGIGSE